MPLTPGTTLGPYEILSPIGAGGNLVAVAESGDLDRNEKQVHSDRELDHRGSGAHPQLKPQIPWLRVFVVGVVIVGSMKISSTTCDIAHQRSAHI